MPARIGVINRVILSIRVAVLRGGVGQRAGVGVTADEGSGCGVVVARAEEDQACPVALFASVWIAGFPI